jgi:hypothetical protein
MERIECWRAPRPCFSRNAMRNKTVSDESGILEQRGMLELERSATAGLSSLSWSRGPAPHRNFLSPSAECENEYIYQSTKTRDAQNQYVG